MKSQRIQNYKNFWKSAAEYTDVTNESAKHVITSIIETFNDLMAAVVSKLLPLLAPLPSAINLYRVLTQTYGYGTFSGLVAASIIEFLAFALAETAITTIFNKEESKGAKWLTGGLLVAYYLAMVIVIVLVEIIATDHANYTALIFPAFSIIATINYGFLRWKDAVAKAEEVEAGADAERAELVAQLAALKREAAQSLQTSATFGPQNRAQAEAAREAKTEERQAKRRAILVGMLESRPEGFTTAQAEGELRHAGITRGLSDKVIRQELRDVGAEYVGKVWKLPAAVAPSFEYTNGNGVLR